jgi:hypothetical protein
MEMYAFVGQIIERFGPRSPGSEAERKAQEWVREQFASLVGDKQVEVQRFRAALTAKFASMKWLVGAFLLAMTLAWFSLPAAAGLGLLAALLFLGHVVMYRDWLDPLFPQMDSSNVTAVLEPRQRARTTLLIAGHVDSATEFRWWYKFGQTGIVLTILAGLVIVLGGFYLATVAFLGHALTDLSPGARLPWFILLLLAPMTIVLWSIHGDRVVDGAIDNLSGLALAWGVGRALADPARPGYSILENTRLKLVSFGSEECGLKGSRAYVREFEQKLRAENAVLLNMESFKDDRYLTLLNGEVFTGARYPEALNRRMADSFGACGMQFQATTLMFGATDATSFANRGLPATCVIGLSSDKLDPTYHTRLDNMEHLDPQGMDKMLRVLLHFIRAWDAEPDNPLQGGGR